MDAELEGLAVRLASIPGVRLTDVLGGRGTKRRILVHFADGRLFSVMRDVILRKLYEIVDRSDDAPRFLVGAALTPDGVIETIAAHARS